MAAPSSGRHSHGLHQVESLEEPGVPTDVREPVATAADRPATSARTHARRGLLLLAVAAWNVWLWVTRAWNLLTVDEGRTTGFIVVHLVLYGASLAIAGVLAVMGWRMRREAREGMPRT